MMEPKAGVSADISNQDREYINCRTVPTVNEIFDNRTGERGSERSAGDLL